LYPSDGVPRAAKANDNLQSPLSDWSAVELCIVTTTCEALDLINEARLDDELPVDDRRSAELGRVLSYTESIFKHQQRTCVFMVLLLGTDCRLVRFDRAGTIASQKFNYRTNGASLIEFLWRYARWPAAARGHDPTVERILPTSPLAEHMRVRAIKDKDTAKPEDYVRRLFEESLDVRWPWWKLRIDDEAGVRFFLVGKPNFFASGVAGRGTKGFVAVDADDINGPFYYLKDAWRVIGLDIDMEGNILQYLNDKAVGYIPTLECHGDVGGRKEQMTETDALWAEINEKEGGKDEKEEDDDNKKKDLISPFKTHRHYRIVVKEVGQPMSEFTSSRQLVHVLRCCILAHEEAYAANVIHRDISAGNVLLYYDKKAKQWCGLLNDWEMSKRTDLPDKGRQLDRTGTWQFMSAMALMVPRKQIKVDDELESFFNVLLYIAIRFLCHNCKSVANFIHRYFDDYSDISGSHKCGLIKESYTTTGLLCLGYTIGAEDEHKTRDNVKLELLTFFWPSTTGSLLALPHPLNTVLTTFLKWTKARYSLIQAKASLPRHLTMANLPPTNQDKIILRSSKVARTSEYTSKPQFTEADARQAAEVEARNLRSHAAFVDLLEDVIQGAHGKWPLADKAEDQLPKEGYKRDANLKITRADFPKSRKSLQKRPVSAIETPEVVGLSKRPKMLRSDSQSTSKTRCTN
ncbi:hypothetical protein BC628DRAFT_1317497, partial [Trametes gibbosa]